jgi:hypothetical protein
VWAGGSVWYGRNGWEWLNVQHQEYNLMSFRPSVLVYTLRLYAICYMLYATAVIQVRPSLITETVSRKKKKSSLVQRVGMRKV